MLAGTAAGHPSTWDPHAFQTWLCWFGGGQWRQYASAFASVSGANMALMSRDDLLTILPDARGAAVSIFNAWQALTGPPGTLRCVVPLQ